MLLRLTYHPKGALCDTQCCITVLPLDDSLIVQTRYMHIIQTNYSFENCAGFLDVNVGLLDRILHASGGTYDRPKLSRICVSLRGPRTNVSCLLLNFYSALHAFNSVHQNLCSEKFYILLAVHLVRFLGRGQT